MAIDLTHLLRPVAVRTSFLGRVEVEARRQSFFDWFRKERDAGHWDDSLAFVRRLLAEQTFRRGEPLHEAEIAVLTSRQLNAFAKAFIKAAGALLSSRYDRDGRRKGGRVGGDEANAQARRTGENESARLLRILTERDEAQRTFEKERLAQIRKMLSGPGEALGRLDPLEKIRRDLVGPSILDEMRRSGAALREAQGLQHRTRSYAEEIGRVIDRNLLGLSPTASSLRQIGFLQSALSNRGSELSRAADKLLLGLGAFSAAKDFLEADRARQTAWGETVRKMLHPTLDEGLLASVLGFRNVAAHRAIETAAELSLGFRTTANLGLAGAASPGAVAQVLSRYRAASALHSELFGDVLGGIERVDAADVAGEDLVEGLDRARRSARRIDLSDPAQASLALMLITLLVMVYQTLLQQDALEIARSSATSADIAAVTAEMHALRDELRKDREEARAEWRHIRYVREVSPLRAEASSGSMTLLHVYPDQPLRILAVDGAWARVEVLAYDTGKPVFGWVVRRRLAAGSQ